MTRQGRLGKHRGVALCNTGAKDKKKKTKANATELKTGFIPTPLYNAVMILSELSFFY